MSLKDKRKSEIVVAKLNDMSSSRASSAANIFKQQSVEECTSELDLNSTQISKMEVGSVKLMQAEAKTFK